MASVMSGVEFWEIAEVDNALTRANSHAVYFMGDSYFLTRSSYRDPGSFQVVRRDRCGVPARGRGDYWCDVTRLSELYHNRVATAAAEPPSTSSLFPATRQEHSLRFQSG